ncbi:MAG: hypothetical protein EAX91_00735 [Candidatus Lokiarchaeota archaeon]|nr:hypothetical protein [Candidatus Lokiarchaeota archaeon]
MSLKDKFSGITTMLGLILVIISIFVCYFTIIRISCGRRNLVIPLYFNLFSTLSGGITLITSSLYSRGRGILLLHFGVFSLLLFLIYIPNLYSPYNEFLYILYILFGIPWPVLSGISSIFLGFLILFKKKYYANIIVYLLLIYNISFVILISSPKFFCML